MILGIESSCDESSVALLDPASGLIHEWTHSQIALHGAYGGVVPDLASREHLLKFPALIEAMHEELAGRSIAGVAVTCGPGLAGCLAVGVALAKSISLRYKVESWGVNHLRGHAFSVFIELYAEAPRLFAERLPRLLPHLGLLVSGGNTLLFEIRAGSSEVSENFGVPMVECALETLAETVDDAAGEALDKGAKLLGLSYPGGPIIEKLARNGDPVRFAFPRAFLRSKEPKFSFSGLKTSLRYRLEKLSDAEVEASMFDLCAGYQEAVVEALLGKTRQFLEKGQFGSLGLSGGVANNRRLRRGFEALGRETGLPVFCAQPRHTLDNAAMIAFAALVDRGALMGADGAGLAVYPSLSLENVGGVLGR